MFNNQLQANYNGEIKTADQWREFIAGGRSKVDRKAANNTTVRLIDGGVAIRLHSTDIVTIHDDGSMILNSGGWLSVTTKERINRYTPARITQRAGVWYMADGSLFYDGMIIEADGRRVDLTKLDAQSAEMRAIRGGDIGLVFQEPRLLPWRTVQGNVRFGVEMQKLAFSEVMRDLDLVSAARAIEATMTIDVADETRPRVVSNMRLEVHQPEAPLLRSIHERLFGGEHGGAGGQHAVLDAQVRQVAGDEVDGAADGLRSMADRRRPLEHLDADDPRGGSSRSAARRQRRPIRK